MIYIHIYMLLFVFGSFWYLYEDFPEMKRLEAFGFIVATASSNSEAVHLGLNIKISLLVCSVFMIHDTISLSCREQVCVMRLHFKRYFSHHWAWWWEKYLLKCSLIKPDVFCYRLNSMGAQTKWPNKFF